MGAQAIGSSLSNTPCVTSILFFGLPVSNEILCAMFRTSAYGTNAYARPTTTFAAAPRTFATQAAAPVAAPVVTYAQPAQTYQPMTQEIDIVQANGQVLREFVQPAVTQTQEIDIVQPNGTVLREFVQNTTQEIDIVQPNGTVLREFVQQAPRVTEIVQAPAPRTYGIISERAITREELISQGRLESGEGRKDVHTIREAQVVRRGVREIDIVQPNGTVLREFVQPAVTQTQEIDFVQADGTVLREFVQNTTQEIDVVQPDGTVLREFVQSQPLVTGLVQERLLR